MELLRVFWLAVSPFCSALGFKDPPHLCFNSMLFIHFRVNIPLLKSSILFLFVCECAFRFKGLEDAAAVNTLESVFWCSHVQISVKHIPGNGIVGSWVNSQSMCSTLVGTANFPEWLLQFTFLSAVYKSFRSSFCLPETRDYQSFVIAILLCVGHLIVL